MVDWRLALGWVVSPAEPQPQLAQLLIQGNVEDSALSQYSVLIS